MTRSLKKGPYVDYKLYKKVTKAKQTNDPRPIRTYARACCIVPDFVGLMLEIHNGNKFIKLSVTEDMIGHKLGEFAPTRTFRGHAGKAKAAEGAAAAPAPAAAPGPAKPK